MSRSRRVRALALSLLGFAGWLLAGCSDRGSEPAAAPPAPVSAAPAPAQPGGEWVVLLDGTSLEGWSAVGDANWRAQDGAVQADSGNGFLVSEQSYANFELEAEFWVDAAANSGIYLRCQDPAAITPQSSYEVNIFDARPDPTYRTGAIVELAPPAVQIDAANRWNSYAIRADGPSLTVTLNGSETASIRDEKFARGPVALQATAGVVKFRSVRIRELP
jgi:hypothetical protein